MIFILSLKVSNILIKFKELTNFSEKMISKKALFYSISIILGITTAQAQFEPQQVISTEVESPYISIPFDIDNDGTLDVVTASNQDFKLRWFKNNDGAGNFETEAILNENPVFYLSIDFVDLDNDGDKDILFLENNPRNIVWLENLDGLGNFSSEQIIIAEQQDFITSVSVIDIDNDGDLDLMTSTTDTFTDKISWYENTNGLGNFGPEILLMENVMEIYPPVLKDIDNDGTIDILTAHENEGPAKLVWYKGETDGTFGPEQEIYQFDFLVSDLTSITYIQYVDVNTNGKKDIVITSHNDDTGTFVYWLDNLNDQGSFGSLQSLPNISNNQYRFFDLDNDEDIDILLWNRYTNNFSWLENSDGEGNFTTERTITTNIDFPADATAGDIDGDGQLDVISASISDNKVAWYKNTGLGIEENYPLSFFLHPNPTTGKVKITSNQTVETIVVFNLLGQKIKTARQSNSIDLSSFESGIYFLQLKTETGKSQTHKIIKK